MTYKDMNNTELVQWVNTFIRNNNVHGFYVSTPWKHKRLKILNEYKNECQICKSKGLYTKADTVHHIKYLRKHPELALTDSNLMALCDDCHYDIHHRNEYKIQLNEERW